MTLLQNSSPLDFNQLAEVIQETHQTLLVQATKAVNVSLTLRNWFIGFYISEFQLQGADRAKYGDHLLADLSTLLRKKNIPSTGLRQLYSYLSFFQCYPDILRSATAKSAHLIPEFLIEEKLRSLTTEFRIDPEIMLNQLSYTHFEQLIDINDPLKRHFYEVESIRGSWSVRELKRQIASLYFERSGLSVNKEALAQIVHAEGQKQTPAQIVRDPYIFEFIGLKPQEVMSENHLETTLLNKLQDFLLELGHGFCFEARQKRLLIGGEYFFVDLVFYHRILKCHILLELKNDSFKHEHLGQLNSYVSYYRQNQMSEGDQPPIGILLCTHKNHELVEYALAGMNSNLFVSRYQVQLPNKEEIAAFLHRAVEEIHKSE